MNVEFHPWLTRGSRVTQRGDLKIVAIFFVWLARNCEARGQMLENPRGKVYGFYLGGGY